MIKYILKVLFAGFVALVVLLAVVVILAITCAEGLDQATNEFRQETPIDAVEVLEWGFRVIDVRRLPATDDARLGKLDYVVTYELNDYRRYMVTIPKDELSDEIIRDAVAKDVEIREKQLKSYRPLLRENRDSDD